MDSNNKFFICYLIPAGAPPSDNSKEVIFSHVRLLQNCAKRIFLECFSARGFSLSGRQILFYLNLLIFLFLKMYFKLDLFHGDKWPNQ